MKTLDPSFVVPPEVWSLATSAAQKRGCEGFTLIVSQEGQEAFQYLDYAPVCGTVAIPWEAFMIITAANLLNPPRPSLENLPVLIRGAIYASDNGRLICFDCAGNAAKYTGYDISGQHVTRVLIAEAIKWKKQFGTNIACECGKTTPYPQLSP